MDFKILYYEDALADLEEIFVYCRLDENREQLKFCSLEYSSRKEPQF